MAGWAARWSRGIRSRLPWHVDRGFDPYPTFAAAAAASSGYDDTVLAEHVALRTAHYVESLKSRPPVESRQTLQNLFVVALTGCASITVVEIGGACGAAFFEIDTYLPGIVDNWTVVETPAMVTAAARFASRRLHFAPSLEVTPRQPDLAMMSGTLNYISDQVESLRAIVRRSPKFLYVTRTATTDAETIYGTRRTNLDEHGPGRMPGAEAWVSVPIGFVPYRDLEQAVGSDYEIVMRFGEDAPWEVQGQRVTLRGFLVRRSKSE